MALNEEIRLSSENPNDDYAVVAEVVVHTGERVKHGQTILIVETSKTAVEVEVSCAGYVRMLWKEDDEVHVGSVLALVFDSRDEALEESIDSSHVACNVNNNATLFSERATELIQHNGMELSAFKDRRFVRANDVEQQMKMSGTCNTSDSTRSDDVTDFIKLSPLKRNEIKNLSMGQNLLTSLFVEELDIPLPSKSDSNAESVFKELDSMVIPCILKAACTTLKKYRYLNAYFSDVPAGVIFYKEVNIGYALDMGSGLKVVNLGDVSTLSVNDIYVQILKMSKKYIRNKLEPQELSGMTFTVTDLSGAEGLLRFTPLIGPYQAIALAIGSRHPESGKVSISLAFDHRVAEGRIAADFLYDFRCLFTELFSNICGEQ